jgi:hypothetical protein
MAMQTPLTRYATRRLTRRLYRAVPLIGSLVAIAMIGSAMRRKGVLRGLAHTALDFVPVVGGVKNVAEAARGRDFFPDKPSRG